MVKVKGQDGEYDRASSYTVICSKEVAEEVRQVIMDMGLFDPRRNTGRNGSVHFPIRTSTEGTILTLNDRISHLGPEVDISDDPGPTTPRIPPITPAEMVLSLLKDRIPEDIFNMVPERYERIGDGLILKMPEVMAPHRIDIAKAFKKVLSVRFVLGDTEGISGELREPSMKVLIEPEDGNYEVVHHEGPVSYRLDPRKVMFSSGNIEERTSFPERTMSLPSPPGVIGGIVDGTQKAPEIIVDMFAGIGYFTLPLAVKAETKKRIFAVEKNPVSFGYLVENVRLNNVVKTVIPILGDNRSVLPFGIADRIIMGYVGGTVGFLDRALDLSRREGAILHFHETVEVEKGIDGLFKEVEQRCSDRGIGASLLFGKKIKSFAPRIDHVVLDIKIVPED